MYGTLHNKTVNFALKCMCLLVWSKHHWIFLGNLWYSSKILSNLLKFLGNAWKCLFGPQKSFWKLLEIFRKWLEIFRKLSKTMSLVCLISKIIHAGCLQVDMEFLFVCSSWHITLSCSHLWDIELNTPREIPYLCAPMYKYSLWI